ncbi:dTDP-4-dehydrorhamnose 3,5-epimerase [soil metagenome]
MEYKELPVKGLVEFFPRVFGDSRGAFFESYSARVFEQACITDPFVQDNQSVSQKNVLRGLHFQNPPYAQGKLVRVISGRALDVAVDLRKNCPTYGEVVKVLLEAEKHNMLYIPPGFAHGFVALEDQTVFFYKCTNFYHPASDSGLRWNDPDLNIDWGVTDPLVSEKDQQLPFLKEFDSPF